MWNKSLVVSCLLTFALGEVIVDSFIHHRASVLEYEENYLDPQTNSRRKLCTLHPLGRERDDSDNFVAAVNKCGENGVIRLPDSNYTIAKPLNISLTNAVLDLHGWLSFSTDVEYWIEHRIPLAFQNQSLAFVIRGHDYVLEGNDKGGIDGGGQAWYDYSQTEGNKFGRPMSLAISQSKNVVIKNFSIIQPQFWASLIWGSENIYIKDFYVNATSFNPASKSDPRNWLQNTGESGQQNYNVTYENVVYQGGDDCIALKPNSSSIFLRNITCFGGTGIAFGSIAQYEGVKDIIQDVFMENLKLHPSSQSALDQGVYFKSWLGRSIGQPPNGGGGGYGYTNNITVKDVYVENTTYPSVVQTDLTYLDIDRQPYAGTGLFKWTDIHLQNFTGTATGNRIIMISCGKVTPCSNWTFQDINIRPGKTDHPEISFTCNNIVLGGNDGLNQCHPSNSTLEYDTN